jgi:hypothetical protein
MGKDSGWRRREVIRSSRMVGIGHLRLRDFAFPPATAIIRRKVQTSQANCLPDDAK